MKLDTKKETKSDKKIAIIAAGQSNIDGRVPITELPKEVMLPMRACHYCSNYTPDYDKGVFQDTLKETDLSANRWGFDLITYYYLTQIADQEVYVMKWSQGGTSIAPTGEGPKHWTPFYEKLPSRSESLLLSFEQLIRTCVEMEGKHFEIKAMIWHQGEADRSTFSPIAAQNYYSNMKHLIDYCRGVSGNKRLPFICGTVSHHSTQYDEKVDTAIHKLASEDPNLYLIDMSHASLLDNFHFDALSSIYFGQRVFDTLIDAGVVSADKLNPTAPWER